MKKLNSFFLVFSICLLNSCDDILEEDITDDFVQTIYPAQDDIVLGNTVVFSWQALDGAEDYRVQVVDQTQQNVIDSLVTSTSLSSILPTGDYQWRIRGENFAYESSYSFPIDFSVETSEDLTSQTVILQTPSQDFYTNNTNFIFTWSPIESADNYTFELQKNLNGLETLFSQNQITESTLTLGSENFSEDSEYIWSVKAENSSSSTNFSERSLFIDTVAPNQPAPQLPIDLEISTSLQVNFNWSNGTDTGNIQSLITNILEISSDFDFNSIIESSTTQNNTAQFTFTGPGTYYWRVTAIDDAGNSSDPSIVRTLFVE